MNDEDFAENVEHVLNQVTARRAPAPLRRVVLRNVDDALRAERRRRWERRFAVAAVLLLVLGLVGNVAVTRFREQRLARLFGPEPVPRVIVELRETVASTTDEETARAWQRRILAMRTCGQRTPVRRRDLEEIRRLVRDLLPNAVSLENARALPKGSG